MNLFSAVHLALAGLCLGLGVLHIAMWFVARRERGHEWAALSFVGFTLLDASIAGSSSAAAGSLGAPEPWLWLTVVTPIVIPAAMAMTLWSIFERRLDVTRMGIALGLVGVNLPISIQIAWLLATDALAAPSWEAVRFGTPWSVVLYEISFLLVTTTWLIEAWLAIPSRGFLARITIVATVVVVILAGWELALRAGLVLGPTLIGVVGLPFGLVASASLVRRYVAEGQTRPRETAKPSSYRPLVRLATGGMGELWLGVRSGKAGFRRFVVIKRIRIDKSDRSLVERFLSEARIAARLHHPNIVSVYDLDRTSQGWSMVMEYLPGPSLWDVLMRCHTQRTFAPIGVVLDIAEQICRGLECAHSHGVMHRDVSPDNVIVTFDGVAKLLDFGIAKEARARARARARVQGITGAHATGDTDTFARVESGPHTLLGGVLGKTQYLAPERMLGGDATPETDLFAVGLVLVQLLGAPIPTHGADLADHPRPVTQHRRDVPHEVEAIVRRALAAHPWARYRSAAAMAADLRRLSAAHASLQPSDWVRELFPQEYARQRELDRLPEPDERSVAALFKRLRPSGVHAKASPLVAPPFPQPSGEDELSLATAVVDPRAFQTPDPPTVVDGPVADVLDRIAAPSATQLDVPRRPAPLRAPAPLDDVDVEGAPTHIFMPDAPHDRSIPSQ